jgi:hypothetical protein
MESLDPEHFRLPTSLTVPPQPSRRPPRHRTGERFLKGPIPWDWLQRAMALPGKALHVALLLWREAGCRKNRTVRICLRAGLPAGLSRWSARRGLKALEATGLVTIAQKPGRCLEVTLWEAPNEAQNGD